MQRFRRINPLVDEDWGERIWKTEGKFQTEREEGKDWGRKYWNEAERLQESEDFLLTWLSLPRERKSEEDGLLSEEETVFQRERERGEWEREWKPREVEEMEIWGRKKMKWGKRLFKRGRTDDRGERSSWEDGGNQTGNRMKERGDDRMRERGDERMREERKKERESNERERERSAIESNAICWGYRIIMTLCDGHHDSISLPDSFFLSFSLSFFLSLSLLPLFPLETLELELPMSYPQTLDSFLLPILYQREWQEEKVCFHAEMWL